MKESDELEPWLAFERGEEVGITPASMGWLAHWAEATGRSSPASYEAAPPDHGRRTVAEAIEWHLLLACLTVTQRSAIMRRGWFDLPWPEQCLVLRVHTRRVPTVDAFHPERHAPHRPDGHPGTYLCSWDIRELRGAARSREAAPEFIASGSEPVALARLVVASWRRGAVKALLEQALTLRVSPGDMQRR